MGQPEARRSPCPGLTDLSPHGVRNRPEEGARHREMARPATAGQPPIRCPDLVTLSSLTQHYGILKSDLVIVIDLAAASVVGRHGGSGEHGDFPGCLHSLALGRVRDAIEWTSAPGWDSELVEED